MNQIRAVVVLGFAVGLATFASVAGAASTTLEINGGYAKSSDDWIGNGESLGGGISFGGAFWRDASPSIAWGAEVAYDNLGSMTYDNGFTANNKTSAHALRVNPGLRIQSGSGMGPSFFAQAGAGLYNVTAKVEDSVFGPLQSTDAKFGFNAGAGVSFPVGAKARMNFNGLYHNVSMDPEAINYLHFRGGVGFSL